jgi:hypothetical protein
VSAPADAREVLAILADLTCGLYASDPDKRVLPLFAGPCMPHGSRAQCTARVTGRAEEWSRASVPEKNAEESPHLDIEADVCLLLYCNVFYPGWELGLARMKCFYIRGLPWLRRVMADGKLVVTNCAKHIPRMKEILKAREGWHSSGFDWSQPFALRKFVDVMSPETCALMSFAKAAEFCVLAEAIVEAIHKKEPVRPAPVEVYRHLRIEAAASYIPRFSGALLERLDGPVLDRLRSFTGQPDAQVFRDMTNDGKEKPRTVTHKLAVRTHHFLLQNGIKSTEIDAPTFRFNRKLYNYTPSDYEVFDLD